MPELLPDREPQLHDWDPAQCLVFLYKYPVLPHGVLPRFLTRTHERSHDRERWRSGVVLEWRGAEAVVRADYDANEVSIWVRGPHADMRRDLLTLVRSHFDAIHTQIEGLAQEIDERVAVPGHPEVTLSFNDLLLDERATANRKTVRVTIAGERVDWSLEELLNGVESPELRARRVRREERLGGSQIHHHHYRSNAQPTFPMGNNINMPISGGTFYGPVAAKMQDCISIISQQANDERKQLLQTLQREAGELIQKLPADKQEEAADNLKLLVESATSEKPKRPWYSVSAEGLMEASKFTKDFTGNIAGTLGQLGKLIWPDFVLSGSGINQK